jgi:hypothetical protein
MAGNAVDRISSVGELTALSRLPRLWMLGSILVVLSILMITGGVQPLAQASAPTLNHEALHASPLGLPVNSASELGAAISDIFHWGHTDLPTQSPGGVDDCPYLTHMTVGAHCDQ